MARRKRKREVEQTGLAEGQILDAVEDGGRLTPVDVQQKVFRLAFKGYNERDVDEFLDEVTSTLAALHEENKRLREQFQEGGAGASVGAVAGAERQAETIVREAREHAARLLEEAERGGAGTPTVGAAPPSATFLVRERAFLQRIASLVQDHARSLKEEARRVRQSPEPAAVEATAGSAPEAATPEEAAHEETTPGDAAQEETTPEEASPEEVQPPPVAPTGSGPRPAEAARPQGGQTIDVPEAEASAPAGQPAPETANARAAKPVEPVGPVPAGAGEEPGDATAPWRPATQEGPGSAGWPSAPSADDPLVSAWESAFVSRPEGEAADGTESEASPKRKSAAEKEEEPSLRELFWGEE
jgi:DivIVA domain-containing protein